MRKRTGRFSRNIGDEAQYEDEDGNFWKGVAVRYESSPILDAFGRARVSEPQTIFDSKQLFDNQPQFWDESLESGAGITSAHSVDTASTVITSSLNTAGKFTRQTFMRFNYQPGKSQLVYMTGILDRSGGGTGVQRRIGYFDDNNGLFFEDDEGTVKVVRRTNVTGTAVDNKVTQADWNIDKMDGTGASGITIDWSKTQIFCFDFEWLGVGRVRIGMVIDGMIVCVHEFLTGNILDKVYMSTPNLPLRYQMITTVNSPVSTIECICSTVISEGGQEQTGGLRYKSTENTHIDAATNGTIYALVGIRLKTTHIGASIDIVSVALLEDEAGNFYEWLLIFNPTVAGTFTYSDETNSCIQTATGATANTVTGGTIIQGGFGVSKDANTPILVPIKNAIRLGSAIDNTVDEIVLCGRPLGGSADLDIHGAITWRELN